jgi:hypothetical protein
LYDESGAGAHCTAPGDVHSMYIIRFVHGKIKLCVIFDKHRKGSTNRNLAFELPVEILPYCALEKHRLRPESHGAFVHCRRVSSTRYTSPA